MIKVTKTAENIYEGIANMMAGAKEAGIFRDFLWRIGQKKKQINK